jgi:hypothetical protein
LRWQTSGGGGGSDPRDRQAAFAEPHGLLSEPQMEAIGEALRQILNFA